METDIDEKFMPVADQVRDLMAFLEIHLTDEALAVQERFREERTRLQLEYEQKVRHDQPELTPDKIKNKLYAPINLGVRIKDGCLEIWWFNTHQSRKKNRASTGDDVGNFPKKKAFHEYIPFAGKPHHYNIPLLLKHAKPWEKALVKETEQTCARLRVRRNDTVVQILQKMDRYDLRSKNSQAAKQGVPRAEGDSRVGHLVGPARDPMEAPAPPPRVPSPTKPGG